MYFFFWLTTSGEGGFEPRFLGEVGQNHKAFGGSRY